MPDPSGDWYRSRVADSELQSRLESAAVVLIEGARACGKTATARRAAASEVFLDADPDARALAEADPYLVLRGAAPRLVDEWQAVPELWNPIRRSADLDRRKGRFLLTGSAEPPDDTTRHTGAGRVSRLRMRPMSLFELGASSGEVSLAGLLDGRRAGGAARTGGVEAAAGLICRGGWPGTLDASPLAAQRFVRDYLNEVRRADLGRASGRRRNAGRALRLLRALARHTASPVPLTTLARDMDDGTTPPTVREYVDELERLFVVEDLPAFAPHLRSRSRLRAAPKRHLVDPSLAAAALGATPERLLADLATLGLLFESLVVRDLRICAQPLDAQISHYRDNTGLEADVIVETVAGDWMAVEVKLGGGRAVEAGAASLRKLRERVDATRNGEPVKLVVVTTGTHAYERPDGVTIVPIGTLGP